MKITTEKFLLENLNQFKRQYPGIIECLDYARIQGVKDKKWPSHVYISSDEVFKTVFSKFNRPYSAKEIMQCSEVATMMYNWRAYKKIYKFDKELSKALIDQADQTDRYSIKIPVDTLTKIPHNGLFIEADIDDNIFGAFIILDYNENNTDMIMHLMNKNYIDDYKPNNIYVGDPSEIPLISGKTIGECMDIATRRAIDAKKKLDPALRNTLNNNSDNFSSADKIQMRIINLILYLIAANSDINRNPEQSKIYRPIREGTIIKDKMREVEIFDVGFTIGRTLCLNKNKLPRKTAIIKEECYNGHGTRKSPHVRCGHWHHYWIGKRGSLNRTLILKWIAPTYVGGYTENTNIISTNPVE